MFDPSVAGVGTHPLQYNYTDPSSGCTATKTHTIQVNAIDAIITTPINPVCLTSPEFELENAISATEGTYTGPSVVGGKFYPQNAGVGDHTITYTTTSLNGCLNYSSFDINVIPPPSLTHDDISPICANITQYQLTGFSDGPGTYTGTHVSNGNMFNAEQAQPGAHTVTYSYTDPSTSCSASISETVIVKPLPTVNISDISNICLGASPIELTQGSPAGGMYSGVGVLNGIFDPSIAGVGTHNIEYEVTDNSSSCSNIATTTITVIASPVAELSPIGSGSTCINESPIQLTQGSPLGGTYSGSGVINGYFYPSLVDNNTNIITYSVANGTCVSEAQTTIIVNPTPNIEFNDISPVCLTEPLFQLNSATPNTGTYSGTGVSNGYFNPQTAGVGVHNITYSFTEESTGCTIDKSSSIIVNNVPSLSILDPNDICENSGATLLTGATPSGGTWSGPGVTSNIIDPFITGPGDFNLTYEFTDVNNCSSSETVVQTVNAKPNTSLSPFLPICDNEIETQLTGGSPSGGTYEGDGVIGGYMYPSQTTVGSKTITYSVTNNDGCTSSASQSLAIYPSPTVTLGSLEPVCINSSPFILSGGSPIGGTWSGNGVTNGIFDPSVAGVGFTQITYVYENENNGCSASVSKNITVKTTEEISIATINPLCENSSPLNLMNYVSPMGGSFSGFGVTDSFFDPSTMGQGTHSVTYTANSTITGCSSSETFEITVNPSQAITFQPIPSVCLSDDIISLNQGTPSGGTYSGPGVIAGDFYPTVAGLSLIHI